MSELPRTSPNGSVQDRPLTGSSRLTALLLDHAATTGLDRQQLLDLAGLSERTLRDPDARLPVARLLLIWQALTDFAPEIDHGLEIAARVTVQDLGLVGYAMETSLSLGDALDRYVRYVPIVADHLGYRATSSAAEATISISPDRRLVDLRHPIDLRLGMILRLARLISDRHIAAARVELPYPRPVSTRRHESLFGVEPEFQRPRAQLTLARADLALPLNRNDSVLCAHLDRLAIDALQQRRVAGSTAAEVRRALWSDLSSGRVALDQVASRMGISAQELQERLEREGVSYTELLSRFRAEASVHLLKDRCLTVSEIAFKLGYAKPATFYHEFRRWRRVTPAQFRDQSS